MIHTILRKFTRFFQRSSKKSSRSHFYYSKIYFRRVSSLYGAYLEKKDAGQVHETPEPINPLGLTFSAEYKDVIKTVTNIAYGYDNKDEVHNHKAVIGRQTISNISLLVQLQFYNDKLFFIGVDISRNAKSDNDKTEIINTIIKKYLNQPYQSGDEFPIIEDKNKNFIVISDDVNFAICYFSKDVQEAENHIRKSWEKGPKQLNKKDKETMFYAF